MQSPRFTLSKEDIIKWLHNAVIFLAPAALVFLVALRNTGSSHQAFIVLYMWALNTAIDLLRKFIDGPVQ
ncbi:MAG: hypothetical protein KGI72_05180 [Patescibacteria group bacterium]|nr:hypothetical protein [Patescibacteria group bacterium]MDE2015885.1 hypothetical protein [Patescibacteria group bacterium]